MEPSWSTKGDEVATHSSTRWDSRMLSQATTTTNLPLTFYFVHKTIAKTKGATEQSAYYTGSY